MASQTGIEVRVTTERLRSTADDVENKIRRLETVFATIQQRITRSRGYWDGDGVSAYIAAYQKKNETIRMAFQRFRENVTDLREIAGVYEEAERKITAENNALSSDWID